jgi:DNA-binding GntR family transcriptional regulator
MSASGLPDRRPRYQVIAESLLERISSGEFPIGATLPTEAQICSAYDVSRHTVREALRSLSLAGVIASSQGVGTHVISDRVVDRYIQRLNAISDLWDYVRTTRREPIELRTVSSADVTAELPGDPDQTWRMLEGLRYVEGTAEAIAWTQVFVLPKYAEVLDNLQEEVLIYALVERRFGIVTQSVRQTIMSAKIEGRVAELLKVRDGACGLAVQREYIGPGKQVYEVTWSVHPADRYRYSMEIFLAHGAG